MPKVPVFTTQPTISPKSGAVGATYRASDGVATSTSSYSRRWLLSGKAIGNARSVVPTKAGSLVLEVTASGRHGSTKARSKAVTVAPLPNTIVAPPPAPAPTPAPVFTTPPSIAPAGGVVGDTFDASDGVATDASNYSRLWLLSGTAIGSGTSVVPASAGSLVLEVTASGTGGSTKATSPTVTVAQDPTAPAPPPPSPAQGTLLTFADGPAAKQFWRSFGNSGPELFAALPNIRAAMGTGLSDPSVLKTSGAVKVTTANAVIENLDIPAGGICLMSASGDVLIRNCRIGLPLQPGGLGPVSFVWGLPSASNLKTVTIEHCELVGDPANGRITKAVEASHRVHCTIRRCHVRNMPADAFSLDGTMLVEYNLVERIGMKTGAHGDAFQTRGGNGHIVRYNVIFAPHPDAGAAYGVGQGQLANSVRIAGAANPGVQVPSSVDGLTAEGNLFLWGGYNLTQLGATLPSTIRNVRYLDNLAGFPEIRAKQFPKAQVYPGMSRKATPGIQNVEFLGNETVEGNPWLHEGADVDGKWYQ